MEYEHLDLTFQVDYKSLPLLISTPEFCSLVNSSEFSDSCCGNNPFCQTIISEVLTTVCRDCKLKYHTFCCGGNKQMCGCSLLPLYENRYLL